MSEFEKRVSSEDLLVEVSSLLVSNSQLVTFPISLRKANSNFNLIDSTRDDFLGYQQSSKSPKKRFHSMDDIFDAVRDPVFPMSDCVPSPESDSSYASSSDSGGSSNSSSPTCEISLLERLIRSHPLWFLPSLQRSGALHLLQGRDVGIGQFIVRSSTQPKTMAVSVKLPGIVEHYLLKASPANKISLENSTHTFDTVHQLIAHYCETSDEIPVCLRIPSIIADATSRQQLASLALLGQEFWSIPGGNNNTSLKDSSTPTDADVNRSTFGSKSGLGSQSSSSHSLCDLSKKPSRPTTLELGICGTGSGSGPGAGGGSVTPTPPPVPLRWSRSALLSPISQPSSIQSTPSEVLSSFNEKSGRPGRKKKRNSGGGGNKAESIHYKDTEILALDLFKGTKTVYDDKASDYEDVWSPIQNHERSHTPRLSTFKKPDIISSASSLTPPDGNHINQFLRSNKNSSNQNKFSPSPEKGGDEEQLAIQNMNIQNHRLSFNGQNLNLTHYPRSRDENISKSHCNVASAAQNDVNRKSIGLYSEPVDSVDSIMLRKLNGNRNAEPNIRWSQPSLSLLKLDFNNSNGVADNSSNMVEHLPNMTGNEQGKKIQHSENKNLNIGQHAISNTTTNCADVSLANKTANQQGVVCAKSSSTTKSSRKTQVTCATSVDNLCHFNSKQKQPIQVQQMINREVQNVEKSTAPTTEVVNRNNGGTNVSIKKANNAGVSPGLADPKNRPEMTPSTETPNKSWCLDNSWDLVIWQTQEEKRLKENVAKFPIVPSPTNTPKLRRKSPSESSQTENSTSSTNNNSANETYNNSLQRRFSCYDNLERSKAEINADDDGTDSDEDKISPPWDSRKWEHLMKIISESTQQLDLLSSVGNNVHNSDSNNVSLHRSEISKPYRGMPSGMPDPVLQVTRMLEVGGNVDKAGKCVAAVVRELATKDDGVFGPTLKSFISCTISAKVQDPYKVMRNVRQFIFGMKNYLVNANSESEELRKEIKKQTETLSDSEFLNIDAILEDVLVDAVISPLHLHIRGLIEAYNTKNEVPLQLPSESDIAQFERAHQNTHTKLKNIYSGLEDSISPMKKLDKWNEFVCQVQEMDNYSTDSFLPLLSETLGSVCSTNLPSHVDYMIGLLPTALAEQNNYSLSMLQSAVSSLKVQADEGRKSSLTCIRVLIPNERNGTLLRKMVPIRNSTTNKEVAKIVSSKLGITNPADYVLVTIRNGEETVCPESELVHNCVDEGATALAYKRLDAKIGWPMKIS